jgi:hypothetical protein
MCPSLHEKCFSAYLGAVDGEVGRFGVAAPFLVAFSRQVDRRIRGILVRIVTATCNYMSVKSLLHLRLTSIVAARLTANVNCGNSDSLYTVDRVEHRPRCRRM